MVLDAAIALFALVVLLLLLEDLGHGALRNRNARLQRVLLVLRRQDRLYIHQ
jgi:hypothetical protein